MKKYDIYYENLNKETYLEDLVFLAKGQQISFHIGGFIIDLTPGISKEEIIKKISDEKAKFYAEHEEVEMGDNEALLMFKRRLVRMCKNSSRYFATQYESHQIIAAPGCTDLDILYQIIPIKCEIVKKDPNKVEMEARPGESYITFGKRIFEELKKGKNIMARFNNVEIPFTIDYLVGNLSSYQCEFGNDPLYIPVNELGEMLWLIRKNRSDHYDVVAKAEEIAKKGETGDMVNVCKKQEPKETEKSKKQEPYGCLGGVKKVATPTGRTTADLPIDEWLKVMQGWGALPKDYNVKKRRR